MNRNRYQKPGRGFKLVDVDDFDKMREAFTEMSDQNERLLEQHNTLIGIAGALILRLGGGKITITEDELDKMHHHAVEFHKDRYPFLTIYARIVDDHFNPTTRWEDQKKPFESGSDEWWKE